MKDGAILANAGHFDVELELDALAQMATASPRGRETTSRSTSWPTGGASSWPPRADSSTSGPPRDTPPT